MDLARSTYDVRDVHLDAGPSFVVFTDDVAALPDAAADLVLSQREGLKRYDDLFAAISSLIYLPALFIAEAQQVADRKVRDTTPSGERLPRDEERYRTTRQEGSLVLPRSPLPSHPRPRHPSGTLPSGGAAPSTRFSGYWRTLALARLERTRTGQLWSDERGCSGPDSWSVRNSTSFLVSAQPERLLGPDPGSIYLVRSAAHGNDVYKIGLTRRTVDERATELSRATGVPLPFDVLASWTVPDCTDAERRIHQALAACRLSPGREFFRESLPTIVLAIERVLAAGS